MGGRTLQCPGVSTPNTPGADSCSATKIFQQSCVCVSAKKDNNNRTYLKKKTHVKHCAPSKWQIIITIAGSWWGSNGTWDVTVISETESLRLLLQAEGPSHVKAGKLTQHRLLLKGRDLESGRDDRCMMGRVRYLDGTIARSKAKGLVLIYRLCDQTYETQKITREKITLTTILFELKFFTLLNKETST